MASYVVRVSSSHEAVFVSSDKDEAQRVHDWYEENFIPAYSSASSHYYIKEMETNPSPFEVEPNFYCYASEVYDEIFRLSVSPVWQPSGDVSEKVYTYNLGNGEVVRRVNYDQIVSASSAQEAMATFKENLKEYLEKEGG